MPISTLFFDLDGTVSNNAVGITRCLNYGLVKLGFRAIEADEIRPFVGPPFRESLPQHFPGIDVEQALRLYRERYDQLGWLENDLYDGIQDALRKLYAQGFTIALCTAKPRIFAERIVEHFGLTRYFNGVHGPEMDGRFDKKTELLAHLLDHYNVAPSHAIMIGDRNKDVEAAKFVGSHSLGVLWGFGSHEELHTAGATRIIESPQHLSDAVLAFN